MMSQRPLGTRLLSYLLNCVRWFLGWVQIWLRSPSASSAASASSSSMTGSILTFDTGRKVRIGPQIAEGGFSLVYQATDAQQPSSTQSRQYALKRIYCPDPDLVQACRHEAMVHQSVQHPHLMPLLGFLVLSDNSNSSSRNYKDAGTVSSTLSRLCYMLFPYYPYSLRDEVNQRTHILFETSPNYINKEPISSRPPWPELTALQLFYRVLRAVEALHELGHYTHRDIKLENILLADRSIQQPVLMDFGSAGPLVVALTDRRTTLKVADEAATHTTISYRPPELLEGAVRVGDPDLDYTKVDVWCLGCTLFAMLYGASPIESEFGRTDGRLRIVQCTQLSVLKPVPRPPAHSVVAKHWYSTHIHELIEYMLTQDRLKRPGLSQVLDKVQSLIVKLGGHVPDIPNARPLAVDTAINSDNQIGDDEDDEEMGISLISSIKS